MKKILLQACYFIPLAACIVIVFLTGGATAAFYMFLFLLFFIGLIGSASAGFNGRTATAVLSGISLLISIAALKYFGLIRPNAAIVDGWEQASFIAGCMVLAVAFLTHNNKELSKLQVFYYVPGGMFLLFSIFSSSPAMNKTILMLLLVAWITVAGLNNMCSSTPIDENETKTQKRKLKIALFIFVFATAGIYSEIIFAVARHTHRNFTSTWTAPEPLGLENWIDHAADGFAGGIGTREDPFLVSTAEQLAYLAKRVNTGSLAVAHVKITGDIDLAGKEWTPIGTRQHPFSGVMDGEGAVIYNLTIATSQNRQGLFGVVSGGFLENLTLINVDIRGRDFVGGIAGVMNGSLRNSSLVGTIEGRHFVGGLSGYGFYHRIRLSCFVGNVKGDVYVGGLVGKHTINGGDRFLAFAYASTARAPLELDFNSVIAAVSGRKYVGGLVGHSGELTLVRHGFFAGKVRGEAFSAGISGFFPLRGRGIDGGLAFLYAMENSADFAEVTHSTHRRVGAAVLRHINGEWYFNSDPLSAEDAYSRFLLILREHLWLEQMLGRWHFTENMLENLRHPFYVLNITYGIEISQTAPLSVELAGKDFNPSLDSFLGGRFWVEDNHFKMFGSMRDIPKGLYAIPCSRYVDGRFETIWILLNVI